MEGHIVIIVTVPNQDIAAKICDQLVTDGLVACGQIIGPIQSIYKWKDKVENDEEYRIDLKTSASNFESIEKYITSIHPYEVPEIIALPILKGHAPYLKWMETMMI